MEIEMEKLEAKVRCAEVAKDILLNLIKLNPQKYDDSKYTTEEYHKIFQQIWSDIKTL